MSTDILLKQVNYTLTLHYPTRPTFEYDSFDWLAGTNGNAFLHVSCKENEVKKIDLFP